jgi:hypothetical protein
MHVSRMICLVGGLLAAVVAVTAPAMAQTITSGSIVFGDYFIYPSTSGGYGAPPFAFGAGIGFNYTSGTQSVTGGAGTVLNGQSVASASLTNDDLQVFASATNANDSLAAAEIWDTLNLGNLPALGGAVTLNTVIGTLNLTVRSGATAGFTNAETAFGLQIYNPATFAPSTNPASTGDCGDILIYTCAGLLAAANNGGALENGSPFSTISPGLVPAPLTLGTNTYSIPLTLGDVASGQLSYTAEVEVENNGPCAEPQDTCALVEINADPSIGLTGLYTGVTVSSASGTDYVSPVPLPAAVWLMLSGLGGVALMGRRPRITARV